MNRTTYKGIKRAFDAICHVMMTFFMSLLFVSVNVIMTWCLTCTFTSLVGPFVNNNYFMNVDNAWCTYFYVCGWLSALTHCDLHTSIIRIQIIALVMTLQWYHYNYCLRTSNTKRSYVYTILYIYISIYNYICFMQCTVVDIYMFGKNILLIYNYYTPIIKFIVNFTFSLTARILLFTELNKLNPN